MRILLDKETFVKIQVKKRQGNIQKIAKFKHVKHFNLIFSKECILRRSNDNKTQQQRLEEMVITDGEQRLITHNDMEMIGDTSTIKYTNASRMQLPTQFVELPLMHTIYKLDKRSRISLVFEQMDTGVIRDIWFEIEDEFVDNPIVMEDIDVFLQS